MGEEHDVREKKTRTKQIQQITGEPEGNDQSSGGDHTSQAEEIIKQKNKIEHEAHHRTHGMLYEIEQEQKQPKHASSGC